MDLSVELQVLVWSFALLPPNKGQKRILIVGRQGSYTCDNGDAFEDKDALCIAQKLRLVSRQVKFVLMDFKELRDVFRPTSPPHHRLRIGPLGPVPRHLLWDPQQDPIYLCHKFCRRRNVTGRRFYGLGPYDDHPYDDHPTWVIDPSSRPAHVILSAESLGHMFAHCGSETPWNVEPYEFLDYFGVHLNPDLLEAQPVPLDGNVRDVGLAITLKKISVVVTVDTVEELEAGNASHSDLEPISFSATDSYELPKWLLFYRAFCQELQTMPGVGRFVVFPDFEFVRGRGSCRFSAPTIGPTSIRSWRKFRGLY